MFCTTCGAFFPDAELTCSVCGSALGRRYPASRRPLTRMARAARWSIALIPVFALLLSLGLGADRWREHQAEKALVYQQAEAALISGDFDAAELSFGALGGYRDAGDRLSEVQAVADPVRQALDEAMATFDAGDYAGAIVLLEAIVAQAPGFGLARDWLTSSRDARIDQLTQQAAIAEANRDWLAAELAIRELSQLQPDDARLAERLDVLVQSHAPIVFAREGAVFIAGPDGEDQRALTRAMGAVFPSWSPDRSSIAFIATSEEVDRLRGTLMLMNGDGSELRAVAEDVLPFSWPVWSPDGRGIAYTSIQAFDTDTYTGAISLNVYELETGIERNLTGDQLAHAGFPTWSPDGTEIAFVSNTIQRRNEGGIDLEDGDIFAVPANGGPVRDLTRNRVFEESWVQWSPNGDRLLIFTAPGDWAAPAKSRLYLLDLASDALEEIVIDEWLTSLPFWSPDGTRIAWVTGGDTINIWSDDGLQWVQLGSDVSSFISWSPDGRYLLAAAGDSTLPSFVIDAVRRVGNATPFELGYDDMRGANGPPLWGGITSMAPVTGPAHQPEESLESAMR